MLGDIVNILLSYNLVIKLAKKLDLPESIISKMYVTQAAASGVGLVHIAVYTRLTRCILWSKHSGKSGVAGLRECRLGYQQSPQPSYILITSTPSFILHDMPT